MGILRPKIQVLDEDHKIKIYTEAKEILETQGIFLENEAAQELFATCTRNDESHRKLRRKSCPYKLQPIRLVPSPRALTPFLATSR